MLRGSGGGGGGGGWRAHVRAELELREQRGLGLRELLQQHEKLRQRCEAEAGGEEEAGEEEGGGPGGSRPPPPDLAPLRVQLEREVAELRRERDGLHRQVALVTDVLAKTEAENQEQRARMGRFAQDKAALAHCYEEAQAKVWLLSREAEGLRVELEEAQRLLGEAQERRQDLEGRWLQEKVMEAKRLNWANQQEEKYRNKVLRLCEKLQESRGAASGSDGS